MRSLFVALSLCLVLARPAAAEFLETELAEPRPDFAEPRRILLQLSSGDEGRINGVLSNAINLQEFYGMDNVQVAIVVFGPGMKALYKDDSPVRDRVESLLKYGIEFIGCRNTMDATGRGPDDLIDGVDFVQAGIAEIVERQLDGWSYIRP